MRAVRVPLTAFLMAVTFVSGQVSSFPQLHGVDRLARNTVKEIQASSNHRDAFKAKDSSNSQCLQSLQAAGVSALSSCPYVQTFINGAMDQTTFLSKFCNDGCAQIANTALFPYLQCISYDASTIYAATLECALRPQCYKGSTLSSLQDFNSCFTPLLNTTDITASGKTTVANVCALGTTCTTKIATFVSQHSDCLPRGITTTVAQAVSFYTFLCSSPTGMTDTCAWNLRNLGRFTCTGSSSSSASGSINNNCATSDNWCTSSGGFCTFNMTDSRLDSLCTPCLTGYLSYVSALGGDPFQVAAIQSLWCSKATKNSTSYCWNVVGVSVLGLIPSTAAGVASTCSGDSGKCAPRLINAYADLVSTTAAATFKSCASFPASYFSFASSCQAPYETSLRSAEAYRRTAAIVCAANVNGTLCYPLAWSLRNDQCLFLASSSGMCGTGCTTSFSYNLGLAGCCAPLINSYLQLQSSTYAATYLPSGTQVVAGFNSTLTYTFTALYANAGLLDRSQQPANAFAVCSNSSALWSVIETPCPASSNAVQRQLSIALAYANLIKNPAAFQKIKQGLRADIANALSLSSDVIRGDDIVENKNLTVKLSASSSRRASTTSSGSTYAFSVDAGSTSATAAASFDALVSTGSLTFTTTASAIVSSCPTCLDASVTLSNPLAAVSAGVNAGTTLAPGATAIPTTSSPVVATLPSSSATSATVVAALAAVLLMVL